MYCNIQQQYQCHLDGLNILHKKVVRIMTNSDYCEHTFPLFKDLKILKLSDISNLSIAVYMYKKINSNANLIQPHHGYPTSNQYSLRVPSHRLTLFQHSLMYKGPKLWNDIPAVIKEIPSLHSFKEKFKKYLLLSY